MWFDDPYEEQEREQEQYEYEDKLREENENLRELAERAWKAAEMLCQAWDGPCRTNGESLNMKPCPMNQCDECDRWKYRDRMRELCVEADG